MSFILQATDITIVNYNCSTFIVQTPGGKQKHLWYIISAASITQAENIKIKHTPRIECGSKTDVIEKTCSKN